MVSSPWLIMNASNVESKAVVIIPSHCALCCNSGERRKSGLVVSVVTVHLLDRFAGVNRVCSSYFTLPHAHLNSQLLMACLTFLILLNCYLTGASLFCSAYLILKVSLSACLASL